MTKKCEAVKSDKFVFDYMEISEDLGFFGENVSKAFPKGIDPYANMEAKTKAKMIRKITEDFKVNHLNKEEIHENKFFKIVGSDEYRSVIKTKSNDNITKYVNLVISDSGEIIQAIESC